MTIARGGRRTPAVGGDLRRALRAAQHWEHVERSAVPLDSNINTLLTSWQLPESRFTEVEKVTMRRILSHQAGLTVWGFPGYGAHKPLPTIPQLLDGVAPSNTSAVRKIGRAHV